MKYLKLYPFHFFVFALLLALILPVVLQDGMFMDGIQYACVSRNLAAGEGTFWFPWLNDSWMKAGSPYFMEHPPLVFGIQAMFFKVLGDTMYTERIYSVITALISAFIIMRIWRLVFTDEKNSLSWLPVMLWIITPVCFWSYQNNMHENTMGVFTLLVAYYSLKSVLNRNNKVYWYLILTGIFGFAAFLCKGLPALFVLSVIPVYAMVFRNISLKQVFLFSTTIIATIFVLFTMVVLSNETAGNSLHFYFYERVLQRINEEPTVTTRFYILTELLREIIPIVSAVALVFIVFWKSRIFSRSDNNYTLFFLLIGYSASLPLMLTTVQRGFYLVPAFPFFALGFACWIKATLVPWMDKIKPAAQQLIGIVNLSLLVAVVAVSVLLFAGKPGRDKEVLKVVENIDYYVPAQSVICTSSQIHNTWNLYFYLTRKHRISLTTHAENCKFYLQRGNEILPMDSNKKGNLMGGDYILFK